MDFTDLNKTCLKDCFPLSRIDQLVDATRGHQLLSFMDAYLSYNQIKIYHPDQKHISFIIDRGLYCYIMMLFELKNVEAVYHKLVNQIFMQQIEKTIEVYVDMLVKSLLVEDHLTHFIEMFDVLCMYRIKLNPSKCVFGVSSGKFLGFMVYQRGIEVNPDKIRVILKMKITWTVREV